MNLIHTLLVLWYFSLSIEPNEAAPFVYYANVGTTVSLQCTGGGGAVACFSTYRFKNTYTPMIAIQNSQKYMISSGSISINNVQVTDAGYYTCAASCNSVNFDQVAYYLQPMSNGQPIDPTQNWIAIPSFEENSAGSYRNYVIVTNESAVQSSGLLWWEILLLVLGVALAVLITIGVIILLCILGRRRAKKNSEQRMNSYKQDEKDTSSVDYSTIDRDNASSTGNTLRGSNQLDKDAELISLPNNKSNISNLTGIMGEITTKNINGPGTYRPNDYLPSIDIDYSRKPPSNRIPSQNNTNLSYVNQIDSMETQPPNLRPGGKIQFPDKNAPDPKTRYVSNENINLKQIIPEPGFMNDILDENPECDTGGGVTVVSARTPARYDPSNRNTSQQQHHQQQQQQQPSKQYPGHLSLSHRIETTTTPFQIPISSSSLRNQTPLIQNNPNSLRGPAPTSVSKDGATDV